MLTTTDEHGLAEKYTYDANGNVLSSVDRNGVVHNNTYDSMNRLKQRTSPDETVAYSYDSAGKRTLMSDGTGTSTYHYDPYTELLTGVDYADGLKLQIPEYDANGNRNRMIGPFGATTTYTYDVMNRIKTVGTDNTNSEAKYNYFRNGLTQQVTAGNGISCKFKYVGLDITELSHVNMDISLNQYQYGYDANKNIQSRTQNNVQDTFTYDELNRVSTSTENGSESYSYDSLGNRTTMVTALSLESAKDTQYTYDKQNQLSQVQLAGDTIQYGYNGDGLLINRTQNGVTTRYYYDGDQIIAEATIVNGIPQLIANYIRGQRIEVIAYADGTKAYPLYNGHGDLVEIRNGQGALLNQYKYDEWGNITYKKELVHNPFRYSGELWDDSTNLQYLRARWYDPSMGRFLNEDTYEGQMDNPLTQNLYTYVGNNPLLYTDPSGHMYNEIGVSYTSADRQTLATYQQLFAYAQSQNNVYIMQTAHDAANLIRLKYEHEVLRTSYVDYYTGAPSKNRGSHLYTSAMYNEILGSGSATAISALDDPMFYVVDGTFTAVFKGLSSMVAKTIGKEGVEKASTTLLKLDLQLFGKDLTEGVSKKLLDGSRIKVELFSNSGSYKGWTLVKDRAINSGAGSHGGSYYKLFDRSGNRWTLDKSGNILRN